MGRLVRFTKMQGIGNDYVYINGFEEDGIDDPGALARRISDRHFGVGSDGLVLVLPSQSADVRMRMFNADGSEAEMCGNAIRCVGKYAYEHGLVAGTSVRVETLAGEKIVNLLHENGQICAATVDMGVPELMPAHIPVLVQDGGDTQSFIARHVDVGGTVYDVTAVSMGNPHAVVFMEYIDMLDLPCLGPRFECHPLFPRRINTEFVELVSPALVRMRVWERGAGETMACGTGACAVAVACHLTGRTGRELDVELRGGTLHIRWDAASGRVFMTGGALTVFEGMYPL